jgi:hypothetical protein
MGGVVLLLEGQRARALRQGLDRRDHRWPPRDRVASPGAEEGLLELDVDAGELALVDAAGASTTLLELELALVDAGELAAASTPLLELDVDAGELALVDAAGAEEALLELDVDAGEHASPAPERGPADAGGAACGELAAVLR